MPRPLAVAAPNGAATVPAMAPTLTDAPEQVALTAPVSFTREADLTTPDTAPDTGPRTWRACIAVWDTPDSYGDSFVRGSIITDIPDKGIPVLVGHRRGDDPVGKVVEITNEDDGAYALVQFAPTERGREIEMLVAGGFYRAVSFAGSMLTGYDNPQSGGRVGTSARVDELSITAFPADAGAVFDVVRDALARAEGDEPEGDAAVTIDGETPTKAMVALAPTNPETLAVEGGDPAEALHVTLKFLGDATDWDDDQRAAVTAAVTEWAAGNAPFTATVSGVGTLGDKNATVLHLDVPGLAAARAALSTAVDSLDGPDTDDKWDAFVPHLTVGYGVEAPDVPVGTEIQFDTVRVHWAEDVEAFDLTGTGELTEPDAATETETEGDAETGERTYAQTRELLDHELTAIHIDDDSTAWVWVRDFTDTWVVYELEGGPATGLYKADYEIADDGTVTFSGQVEVEMRAEYVARTNGTVIARTTAGATEVAAQEPAATVPVKRTAADWLDVL